MRVLYVAADQVVPGTLGGSVHVQAVAEGLAELGHDVHVATRPGGQWPGQGVHWHAMAPPLGTPALRYLRKGAVLALARRIRADVIMERYYNFGGEGIFAARDLGIPSVLEVNAPVIDYPGSTKHAIDRALLFEPFRRWRDRMCRATSLFVTTTAEILPAWVNRSRVLEVEWGADVDHFRPIGSSIERRDTNDGRIVCVFAGAFRTWHGAVHLAAALARLNREGDHRFAGLFIGDGPERAAVAHAARDVPDVRFVGARPHDELPGTLASADIGVAPFDPVRHGPLRLGFYWSPLKIFEYMATGLPIVAPALPRLERLVAHGVEGLLYPPDDPRGLDRALQVLSDPALRRRMGQAARTRAVKDYSWSAHCKVLSDRLKAIAAR
jgi:glycosyltransferase involved in cell wall biosynthesis